MLNSQNGMGENGVGKTACRRVKKMALFIGPGNIHSQDVDVKIVHYNKYLSPEWNKAIRLASPVLQRKSPLRIY